MTAPRDPDEPYADRLRDALRAEAELVNPPGDGLARIRARTRQRSTAMRWFRPLTAIAAAAVVVLAVVGGVALVRDDGEDTLVPAPGATSPVPTPTTSPSTSTGPSPATPGKITVPVYYLQDTERGPRLYREFHRVTSPHKAIHTAVHQMLVVDAQDDDYTSLWPDETVVSSVVRTGDLATVDLSAQAAGPFNGGAEFAELSVQQLVWTVTAADPEVRRVQILIDGETEDSLWGHVDVSEPQRRTSPSYEVLGPVWVLAPAEGQTASSPVTLSGVATVFEANVSIEILRDGEVIRQTFATATEGAPGRGTWTKSVNLPAGTYEVRAFESSAESGEPMYVDDKTFTVT